MQAYRDYAGGATLVPEENDESPAPAGLSVRRGAAPGLLDDWTLAAAVCGRIPLAPRCVDSAGWSTTRCGASQPCVAAIRAAIAAARTHSLNEVFFCLYCGTDRPENERSLEHPLPQAIGGAAWGTRHVCDECNRYCGREIDRPLASDFFVLDMRHRYEIPDARGVVPPAPRKYGRGIPSGRRIEVESGRDAITARCLPHRISAIETQEHYVVDPNDAARILRLRAERIRKQRGAGFEVRAQLGQTDGNPDDRVQIDYSVSADVWPRFGAKLGLGLGARGMGDAWLRSDWAAWLRARLRGSDAASPGGIATLPLFPESLSADDSFARLSDPPQHTIVFTHTDPTVLVAHLFGSWRYGVPLGPNGPRDGPAWTFDPRTGTAAETTLIGLIIANRDRFTGPV